MKNKKIAIFSGAGVSRESGVLTFRDCADGLWENHKVEDVASIEGWKRDRSKVLDFYNARRQQMPTVEPNDAHKLIAELENEFSDVTVITQNVDDLHERAGSTDIVHLHGELTKARGEMSYGNPFQVMGEVFDIGYEDINVGDMASDNGSQLRPHIVWFGEFPFGVSKANNAIKDCDILIIIGTSLTISYTHTMLTYVSDNAKIYYVDPEPCHDLDAYGLNIEYIVEPATIGMKKVFDEITKI